MTAVISTFGGISKHVPVTMAAIKHLRLQILIVDAVSTQHKHKCCKNVEFHYKYICISAHEPGITHCCFFQVMTSRATGSTTASRAPVQHPEVRVG